MASTLQHQAQPYEFGATPSRKDRADRQSSKNPSSVLQQIVDQCQSMLSKSKKDRVRLSTLQEIAHRLESRENALTQQLGAETDIRKKRRLVRELRVIEVQRTKTARLVEELKRG